METLEGPRPLRKRNSFGPKESRIRIYRPSFFFFFSQSQNSGGTSSKRVFLPSFFHEEKEKRGPNL